MDVTQTLHRFRLAGLPPQHCFFSVTCQPKQVESVLRVAGLGEVAETIITFAKIDGVKRDDRMLLRQLLVDGNCLAVGLVGFVGPVGLLIESGQAMVCAAELALIVGNRGMRSDQLLSSVCSLFVGSLGVGSTAQIGVIDTQVVIAD